MTTERTAYHVDNDTFDDITAWCEHYLRSERVKLARDRMIRSLEALTPREANNLMAHGWEHVHAYSTTYEEESEDR